MWLDILLQLLLFCSLNDVAGGVAITNNRYLKTLGLRSLDAYYYGFNIHMKKQGYIIVIWKSRTMLTYKYLFTFYISCTSSSNFFCCLVLFSILYASSEVTNVIAGNCNGFCDPRKRYDKHFGKPAMPTDYPTSYPTSLPTFDPAASPVTPTASPTVKLFTTQNDKKSQQCQQFEQNDYFIFSMVLFSFFNICVQCASVFQPSILHCSHQDIPLK